MDKVKIQEIADEAGLSNNDLLDKAKELGFNVKAANDKITMENAGILVDYAISGTLPKGFKKPQKRKGISVVSKKKLLDEIIIKELKTFFDDVYSKKLHVSCLALPILKILITKNEWFKRNNIIEELKKYGDFKRGQLSFDHLWSQRFGKGKESKLLNKIVEHDALSNGQKKTKYRIKDNVRQEVKYFLDNYTADIQELIDERLKYTDKTLKNIDSNIVSDDESKEIQSKIKFSDTTINYDFPYKNILLKGVPGTGKSRTIENIIHNHLNLSEHYENNVLRINIHSASTNADLMQGIGISSNNDGHIEYKEKQGLILELIEKATFNPNQPFVLVLEEIQENSLNELIGDLIYLIEDSKRAKDYKPDNQEYTYSELIDNIMNQNEKIRSIKLPNLISQQEKTKRMIIPHNLYIFCTSNYRDDRKVIEDNLLRRFEVIEIYPKYKDDIGDDFKSDEVSEFLKELNKSIVTVCQDNGEIHPDRFMIGHSIWLEVEDYKTFSRAFLKVLTEFKDIKDMHFDDFQKITKELNFPFELLKEYNRYEEWIRALQNECYDFLR